jgi:hypothetical protein
MTKWRAQLTNVVIKKKDSVRNLGGYIVAPRWVTVDDPDEQAVLFVEDPPGDGPPRDRQPDGGEPDDGGLELLGASMHVGRNLRRLGLFRLALWTEGRLPRGDSATVPIFRCVLPELADRLFVGRHVGFHDGSWPWSALFDGLDLETVTGVHAGVVPPIPPYVADRRVPIEEASVLTDGSVLVPRDLMVPVGEKNLAG